MEGQSAPKDDDVVEPIDAEMQRRDIALRYKYADRIGDMPVRFGSHAGSSSSFITHALLPLMREEISENPGLDGAITMFLMIFE